MDRSNKINSIIEELIEAYWHAFFKNIAEKIGRYSQISGQKGCACICVHK